MTSALWVMGWWHCGKNMLNCLQLKCWNSNEACGVTQTFLPYWFNQAWMHSHCAHCTVTVCQLCVWNCEHTWCQDQESSSYKCHRTSSKTQKIVYIKFWDGLDNFEGFINFYNKRNGQEMAKSRKNRGACKQGCLWCPLRSNPGLQGCFDETGACRTGVFMVPRG